MGKSWHKRIIILADGLTEYYGKECGEDFIELVLNISLREIVYKRISEIIYKTFVEYVSSIIKDQDENFVNDEGNVLYYIQDIIDDFIQIIAETDVNEIEWNNRKYIVIDSCKSFIDFDIEGLNEKSLNVENIDETLKVFIIHKNIEVPPIVYFWARRTNVEIFERNPMSAYYYSNNWELWKHRCPFRV